MVKAMQRQGVIASVTTYSALISACETSKHLEQALEVFKTLE